MVPRRAGGAEVEVRGAAAAAVEGAAEVAGAACLVAMSRTEPRIGERAQRASDLRQEERRRRREVAQAAQAQSERRAKVAEEVHWARVRAAMAAVALRKGGRRWRPCAARAVVKAVRVAGGGGTIANESRAIDLGAGTTPPDRRGVRPEMGSHHGVRGGAPEEFFGLYNAILTQKTTCL